MVGLLRTGVVLGTVLLTFTGQRREIYTFRLGFEA